MALAVYLKIVSQRHVISASSSLLALSATMGNRRRLFSTQEEPVPNKFAGMLDEQEVKFYKLLEQHRLVSRGLDYIAGGKRTICDYLSDCPTPENLDFDHKSDRVMELKHLSETQEKLLFIFEIRDKDVRNFRATLTKERIENVVDLFQSAKESHWEYDEHKQEVIKKLEQQFEELKAAEKKTKVGTNAN